MIRLTGQVQLKWPYAAVVALYCAAIFWMSSRPDVPTGPDLFDGQDKVVHALVYAGLAALVWLGLRRSNARLPARVLFWAPLAFASLYGVTDELHQWFVPHRSCELADLGADAAGALAILAVLCRPVRRDRPCSADNAAL